MIDAVADLATRRPSLDAPPLVSLVGRFHSHVTVHLARAAALDALREIGRAHGAKVTVIDLERFADGGTAVAGSSFDRDGARDRDVMTTRYHVDAEPGALGRIADALGAMCAALEGAGIPVVRVKVEHESEPSLPRFDAERYHEVHVKLDLDAATFDLDRAWLAERSAALGWVPSRNPYERRQGRVLQFVTLRMYDGDRRAADVRVAEATAALTARGLAIVEVKRETAVLDTRADHDKHWARADVAPRSASE